MHRTSSTTSRVSRCRAPGRQCPCRIRRVDGAGSLALLRSITLLLLKAFAAIILLITAVSTLPVFDLVQTMTGGGPFFASEVMEIYI
jgi:ABC-type sugar transport system permease subunit